MVSDGQTDNVLSTEFVVKDLQELRRRVVSTLRGASQYASTRRKCGVRTIWMKERESSGSERILAAALRMEFMQLFWLFGSPSLSETHECKRERHNHYSMAQCITAHTFHTARTP